MAAKRSLLRLLLRIFLITISVTVVAGTGVAAWAYVHISRELPQTIDVVTDYRPMRASSVWSANHELIGEFFAERRTLIPIAEVPSRIKQAFIAAEDARFRHHHGIDYAGIVRAAIADLKAGHIVQGGSTITQQVAKMLLVGQKRSFSRKAREALLAWRMEDQLDKEQILGIYLNNVFFGHGAYGIAEASMVFFGKEVKNLTVAEAALLAALPKAPSDISPFHNYARARVRQLHVIAEMQRLHFISGADADAARREALVLVSKSRALTNVAAPYFVETVRQAIVDRYGDNDLLRQGLRVETTLDMRLQRSAEAAVRDGLSNWHRRYGFSGPLGRLGGSEAKKMTVGPPRLLGPDGFAVDNDGALALLSPAPPAPDTERSRQPERRGHTGRAKAAEEPPPEETDPSAMYAAVVVQVGHRVQVASGRLSARLDPADENHALAWRSPTGERIAVGDILPVRFRRPAGRDAIRRHELTATLADNPSVEGALIALAPGNGHLLAMVGGYDYRRSQFNRATQAHRQVGSAIKPFVYAAAIDKGMTELTIRNDGPVKFSTSSGTWSPHNYKLDYRGPVTLRTAIAESINTVAAQVVAQLGPNAVIEIMRRMGISSKLPMSLSIALGAADLSLQEMAYGLAGFAAGGKRVTPLFITKVMDADGRVLEEMPAEPPREQSIDGDTAYIITDMMKGVVESGTGRQAEELKRPVAGKTGTANNYRDAWFFGFTPDILCGVWVGRDNFKPISHGATGAQVALPIWLSFMHQALDGTPIHDFAPPPGVVFARADPEKGVPVTPGQKHGRLIPFKRGTLPPAFMTRGRASFSGAEF
jgi:penicillin-binding protein 1A